MKEEKPTLDYEQRSRQRLKRPVEYIGAAAAIGMLGGGAIRFAGLLFLDMLGVKTPTFKYDTEAGDFIAQVIEYGCGVGLVIGLIVGIRRWRRWL